MVDEEKTPGTFSADAQSVNSDSALEEERELIARATAGHRPSLERLIARYERQVYIVAYRFFNHPEDAGDATQEVFLRMCRALPSFAGRSSFRTWLYRIAANTCLTLLQKKKRRQISLVQALLDWFSRPPAEDPGEVVVREEYQRELRAAVADKVARLPEAYRMPVILRDLEGLSLEEIGEVLELKEGTVKSRINRGRRLLQESLETFYARRES
jgi:RNA polymerase sigma-70 factor, ECF subfamily